jgi:hypothetical protein
MLEQDDLRQGEAEVPSPSGLLLSVEPLEETGAQGSTPSYRLSDDTDSSDTSDTTLTDTDGTDTADADGTDDNESDADGTDASDADGTDTGADADGTDPLGIAEGDTGPTVNADGTDAS